MLSDSIQAGLTFDDVSLIPVASYIVSSDADTKTFLTRELQINIRITPSGLRESHVHDIIITKEAPNYQMEWGL